MPKFYLRLFVTLMFSITGLAPGNERAVDQKQTFFSSSQNEPNDPILLFKNSAEEKNNFLQHIAKARADDGPRIMPNGVSVPGDFPYVDISVNKETADGYIFINNWSDQSPYNIIFDNDGSPVWYERQIPGDRRSRYGGGLERARSGRQIPGHGARIGFSGIQLGRRADFDLGRSRPF